MAERLIRRVADAYLRDFLAAFNSSAAASLRSPFFRP
jgi:hypothetical protein